MLSKDYYLRLGVSRREPAEKIRHAFCEQVKRYHPERVGAARGRFFDELVEAYHMLSNAGGDKNMTGLCSNSELDVAAELAPQPSAAGSRLAASVACSACPLDLSRLCVSRRHWPERAAILPRYGRRAKISRWA